MDGWIEASVVENRRWNERLCSLRVSAEQLPEFRAGQFLRLGLLVEGQMLARAYSLVNAPGEAEAEFYFNKVPDGPLSPRLHELQQGDRLWLSKMVAGFLTLDDIPPGKRLWMLATGTALGPFLSILKTEQVWQQYQQVILVHGVRSTDELTYRDLLADIKKQAGDRFLSLQSVTREAVAGAMSSRIPDAIASGELEALAQVTCCAEGDRFMLCGNPGLIEQGVKQLELKGMHRHRRRKPGQIVVEIYK